MNRNNQMGHDSGEVTLNTDLTNKEVTSKSNTNNKIDSLSITSKADLESETDVSKLYNSRYKELAFKKLLIILSLLILFKIFKAFSH